MAVFKLQRPLSDPGGEILCYDQHRSRTVIMPQSKPVMEMFGDRVKIYVEADIVKRELVIKHKVADREW